ncbi:hypothetical protein H9P43_007438 [Blastocladiella emersonii ATCC 22665]|nr:hypothetical protein H9P43_007438 [Blastocladiella emersonii ATCC 22665]
MPEGLSINDHLVGGQWFSDIKVARKAVRQLSAKSGYQLREKLGGNARACTYLCGTTFSDPATDPPCQFRLTLSKNKAGCVYVVRLASKHQCSLFDHTNKSAASKKKFLVENQALIAPSVASAAKLTPSAVMTGAHTTLQARVSKSTAGRVVAAIRENTYGSELSSFQTMPSFLEAVRADDPLAQTALRVDPETGKFGRVALCTGATRAAAQHCLPMIGLEGTFTIAKYQMTLLLTGVNDTQNQVNLIGVF